MMEILANGFTVIRRASRDIPGTRPTESLVLAENPGREEFATWEENGNLTFWGHYFPYYFSNTNRDEALNEARKDFELRLGRTLDWSKG